MLALLLGCTATEPPPPWGVVPPLGAWTVADTKDLERIVRHLASDELKGRNNGTESGVRAAQFVAGEMAAMGLEPAGENGTYFQTVKARGEHPTRNVLGLLRGETDELIVIAAHHDHLGVVKGVIHNGADDNASGVAVVLDVARGFTRGPKLGRSLLVCSFDAEEDGLVGSRYFVTSGLVPKERMKAMLCFDLVGGCFLPGDEKRVFALGSECSRAMHEWVGRPYADTELEVRRAGIHLVEPMGPILARSDYAPFRSAKIPYVFFSTGTPWYYHTPEDDVERLDFAKMKRLVWYVRRLVGLISSTVEAPDFKKHEPDLRSDAAMMVEALGRLLDSGKITATAEERVEARALLDRIAPMTTGAEIKGGRELLGQAMVLLFAVAREQAPGNR